MKKSWLAFMMIALISCHSDDLVDRELDTYLVRFSEEAAMRGIVIDFKKDPIEARLEVNEGDVALGRCMRVSEAPNQISINLVFWNLLDELEKEKLVFHELGHCVLDRPHKDHQLRNGHCSSLMHSGQACSDNYSPETRKTYLDELFTSR